MESEDDKTCGCNAETGAFCTDRKPAEAGFCAVPIYLVAAGGTPRTGLGARFTANILQ